MLTAVVADARSEPAPAAWERFVAAQSLPATWGSGLLAALAWYAHGPSYLGVVADRSGAPCAVFHLRHLGLPARPDAFVAAQRPPLAGIVECRLPPTTGASGYRFAAGLDVGERRAALRALERALAARLGRRASAILYRNVLPADVPAFAPGRLRRRANPEVVVDNRWSDVDAFLADLPAKRRSALRGLDARVAGDGGLLVADERRIDPAAASRLAASVTRRHRSRARIAPPLPAAWFDGVGGRTGVEFLTYRAARGELLAFGTLVDDGRELADSIWGNLDARDGGVADLYFHHYLRSVRHLIERGRARLVLGKGLGALKLRYAGRYEERSLVGARL